MKHNYTSPLEKLLTPTILLSVGLIIYKVTGFTNLLSYASKHELYFIIGLMLMLTAMYLYIVFILDNLVESKDDVLYLHHKYKRYCYFIDKKGNIFKYRDNDYKEKVYYSVLKTHSVIYKIKGESNKEFDIAKDSYLYLYLPFYGKVDIYISPLLYLLFILFIVLSFIYKNIFIHILVGILLLLVLFDIYNKVNKEEYLVIKIRNIILSILLFVILVFIIISIFNSKDIINTLVLISILSVGILTEFCLIYNIINDKKEYMFRKITIFVGLIYLLIYSVYLLISSIKSNAFPFVIISCLIIALSIYKLYKDYLKKLK